MRRLVAITAFVAALLGCAPTALAGVVSSLTTTITMDCSMFSATCAFDPGGQGSPEHGFADFTPVAPGWSAAFDSAPAIAWGDIFGAYIAEFGRGGSFAIAAPGGMQLSGMLTSGVAFSFPSGDAEEVALFRGHWDSGSYAEGVVVWNKFDDGASVILDVTTYTPEPGSLVLFGSAFPVLAGILRRNLR